MELRLRMHLSKEALVEDALVADGTPVKNAALDVHGSVQSCAGVYGRVRSCALRFLAAAVGILLSFF